ncbi:unnamed protein product [Darwinula stevensoni]|uniref:ATP-dependent RNA helicase DHX34 n=1 Tax=Darwinula stevensoni TaxID=69355 RepID=A0A7R9A776_9CRUS|nr:unnamed protein product [Darwinula stevensoni]CAG0891967.1 unnamed protein product [Darwinula stevensoni]
MSRDLGLPKSFDQTHLMNLTVKDWSMEEVLSRRPPRDLDDDPGLSRDRIAEFRKVLHLYLDFSQKEKFLQLKKLRQAQANLPIAAFRDEIVETVKENPVVIVAGDTGCGKSTQVPQYLLRAGFKNIACTQPRRIACISLCKRVSQDPLLSIYDVIVLDEVHERHLHGDFLLGIIKCLLLQRMDLKVILMSATINIELFQEYFAHAAPVIKVPGRLYPIQVHHRPITSEEKRGGSSRTNPAPYVRIMQLIDAKYSSEERGDLLVFLSGMTEITTVAEAARVYAQQTQKWIILTLHSTLPLHQQDKVFDVAPEGVRKCIISTNIAETSVTIDGIRFVADSGRVKEMSYDATSHMQRLQEFPVSRASAEQRKGRAGLSLPLRSLLSRPYPTYEMRIGLIDSRTGPGVCYRLYSEEEWRNFAAYSTPEIQRVPLESLVLQMISLGLPDPRKFPFIQPPPPESLEHAINSLKDHGALDEAEGLTTMGRMLSQLPIDVTLGKLLVNGSVMEVREPVLSLAALLAVQSPLTNKAYRDSHAQTLRASLESDHGDPLTLLNIYCEWLEGKGDGKEGRDSRRWCRDRGVEEQRLYEVTKLRQQFQDLLQDSGLVDRLGRMPESSEERRIRYGELKQLRSMKRKFHETGGRRRKVLRPGRDDVEDDDDEGGGGGDRGASREDEVDIRDVEFRIRNDATHVRALSSKTRIRSFQDMTIVKMVLVSALYPQVAVPDDHNSYRPGSDQVYHTKGKAFTVLHPMGKLANDPQVLQITEADILDFPGFARRNPVSTKHQLLLYVSLLETTKPYIVNTLRVPAAHSCLLFSRSVDSNPDFSRVVCDEWLELRFPDVDSAQLALLRAAQIRTLWMEILATRLSGDEDSRRAGDSRRLQRLALQFYLQEVPCSVRRLLPADTKHLYKGDTGGDIWRLDGEANPFSTDGDVIRGDIHPVKGGLRLTPFLTYDWCRTLLHSRFAFFLIYLCCLEGESLEGLRGMGGMGEEDEEESGWTCPHCETLFPLDNVFEKLNHMRAYLLHDHDGTLQGKCPCSSQLRMFHIFTSH